MAFNFITTTDVVSTRTDARCVYVDDEGFRHPSHRCRVTGRFVPAWRGTASALVRANGIAYIVRFADGGVSVRDTYQSAVQAAGW